MNCWIYRPDGTFAGGCFLSVDRIATLRANGYTVTPVSGLGAVA